MDTNNYYWQRNLNNHSVYAIEICSRETPSDLGSDNHVIARLKPFDPSLADRIVDGMNRKWEAKTERIADTAAELACRLTGA